MLILNVGPPGGRDGKRPSRCQGETSDTFTFENNHIFLTRKIWGRHLAKRRFPDQSSMSTASSWWVALSWLKKMCNTRHNFR